MQSTLTKAYTIKIENFEGPFDLLFHLIEKNKVSIYDIPINEITDQYMEYLFGMQKENTNDTITSDQSFANNDRENSVPWSLNLEIASEFIVMAATLLHIKSKMLLPDKKEKQEDEIDPREELVLRLIEYKKYKEFAETLKEKEKEWEKVIYKLPEVIEFNYDEEIVDLSPDELKRVYCNLLQSNISKINKTNPVKMAQIVQHEKVSLRSEMREIVRRLYEKTFFAFSEMFSFKSKSKIEVVTGFMAILELSKLSRVRLDQNKQFSEIIIHKNSDDLEDYDEDSLID